MATKRLILSNIWEDEFFGTLSFFNRLLWIGLFSRCADDQGRMIDNPVVIRSQVFPYDDIPARDINDGLEYFANEGKIIRYEVEGKRYIQIVKWWENQSMQWAMFSKYPSPPAWDDRIRTTYKGQYYAVNWTTKQPTLPVQVEVPGGDTTLPPDVGRQNPNLNPNLNYIKEDEEEEKPAQNIFALYEQNIGPLTPMLAEKLKDAEEDYPPEWVPEAFKIAIENNARNWAYVKAILERWKVDGFKSDTRPRKNGKLPPVNEPAGFAGIRAFLEDQKNGDQ